MTSSAPLLASLPVEADHLSALTKEREYPLENPEADSAWLQELKEKIEHLDLSMIRMKMIKSHGWSLKEASETEQLYRNYLFLCAKYKKKGLSVVPSEDVDEFWHNHILDTQKYPGDCDKIFGFFLHHYPYFGIDAKSDMNDLAKAFKITQELHKKEFGDYIYEIRGRKIERLLKSVKKFLKSMYQKITCSFGKGRP